jgi:hypothetical protein
LGVANAWKHTCEDPTANFIGNIPMFSEFNPDDGFNNLSWNPKIATNKPE